ncbi:MAG: flagellar export protein FliJ [Bacteroidales bacterium]|nr:flagellar export protein FliJ [Clostridium sp.]MCM1202724.1 flagellar export protein FliJ [Bacteroidales bacterium]
MAKFVYRMQNILDIKYKLEEQAKQHYMEVRAHLNAEIEVLEQLNRRKEEYFVRYRQLVSSQLDLVEIEECKSAIILMDEYIFEQQAVIDRVEKELDEAVQQMNEAMKERKIQEKLRENQFEVFLQELNQEEAKEIDELVSYQYNHKQEEEV